jgi:hypothetical protein
VSGTPRASPLNLPRIPPDQSDMAFVMSLLLALFVLYLAYRAIRGGFERPQSARLNGYGVFGCVLLMLVALSYLGPLLD